MSFLLLLVFLSLKPVFCEKCSQVLHNKFKKEFDLTRECDSCWVLLPPERCREGGWSGFCVKNKFFLFEDWKCRQEDGLMETGPFVVVNERFCERSEKARDLDEECLMRFNSEVCDVETGFGGFVIDKDEGCDGKGLLSSAEENTNLEVGIADDVEVTEPLGIRVTTTARPTRSTERSTKYTKPTETSSKGTTKSSPATKTSSETERSSKATETSTEATEVSLETTTETKATETSTELTETSSELTETSTETTETSTKATETSSELTETSTETTETSTELIETSSELTETSTETTETSEPTETSFEATETSFETMETSTKATKTSFEATETSTKATEISSETTETSTDATEVSTTKNTNKITETSTKTAETSTGATTGTSSTKSTREINTSSSSTTIISTSWSFPSSKSTSSPESTLSSTEAIFPPPPRKTCEPNEFFYNNYCYFIKYYQRKNSYSESFPGVSNPKFNKGVLEVDSIKSCQERHSKALGLAVETEEENYHVLEGLKSIHLYNSNIIFTSGVRVNSSWGEWIGWGRRINNSILKLKEFQSSNSFGFYCIDSCEYVLCWWCVATGSVDVCSSLDEGKGSWYVLKPEESKMNSTFLVMCKRPYNPKNSDVHLHERCLEMYRKSSCYNLSKHEDFCCAMDEQNELWFACPGTTEYKYPNELKCGWSCRNDGFFSQDRPSCTGKQVCSASYNKVKYVAPIRRFATSSCPWHSSGYSSWYCNSNKSFSGTPDYSFCCDPDKPRCKNMDPFLNIWMGCSSTKLTKRTACPRGTVKSEAVVEWTCLENGTFLGSTPDYSRCNESNLVCLKKDRFGREWMGLPGTTVTKQCPPSFSGDCNWKCRSSGHFEGPEPDCSKCKAGWMDDIADKIKNKSQHEEVMEIMENYTKHEDIRIGFSHVINLTAQCVTLYKQQSTENNFSGFGKFLKSFSKILKNVAGDSNVWTSFTEDDRLEYVDSILKTTQKAAFANLEMNNSTKVHYNVTLTTSGVEGFEFFVAYNPPTRTNFPLQDISQSDWHLRIQKMNDSNENFAAMGLVLNSSLGSLMFPRGNGTKKLEVNGPVITFTVATATDGGVEIDPNVSVVLSFRHTNRTRFPAREVIRRKLHAGESPSGVFNSTLCFYYSDSDWTTEGCSVTHTSKDQTNCTCNHLSTIGLLMSIHKYEPDRILELTSAVSSGITIVSLVLALLVFYLFDKGNNDRVLIGKNLCFCLLLGHILLFSVMDKKYFNTPDALCKVYAILLHYVFTAAFAWMLVEGCHLYRMLVLVFDSDVDYRWIYLLIGYGVPFVVVGATELVGFVFREQPYGEDELCWLKTPNYVWAFIAPVTVITSINFVILIVAMKLAITSKRRTEKSTFGTVKLWVKGWITLSTLLGITWLLGLGYICYSETFAYAFVVFNGLQGFFIFIFRCVLCEQYKTAFLKKIKSWFLNSKTEAFGKIENVKSDTKVYAVSGSKSSSGEAESKDSGYETVFESKKHSKYKFLDGFLRGKPKSHKPKNNASAIDIDINITLTPAMSEAYLRNRMIAKNFSARRSKATWLAEENFQELSYHNDFID